MHEAVIFTRDASLRERIRDPRIDWVDDPDQFETTLAEGLGLAMVDVCMDCADCDVAAIVRDCRDRGGARRVIAFLTACGGDAAIRAHLAGADRVIPLSQLEDELGELLDS